MKACWNLLARISQIQKCFTRHRISHHIVSWKDCASWTQTLVLSFMRCVTLDQAFAFPFQGFHFVICEMMKVILALLISRRLVIEYLYIEFTLKHAVKIEGIFATEFPRLSLLWHFIYPAASSRKWESEMGTRKNSTPTEYRRE